MALILAVVVGAGLVMIFMALRWLPPDEYAIRTRSQLLVRVVAVANGDPWFALWKNDFPEQLTPEQCTELFNYVETHEDKSSYIALMLLRRDDTRLYQAIPLDVRARILVDALANASTMDEWCFLDEGLPIAEPAGVAIVECGNAAIRPLYGMLDDTRPAQRSHGEEILLAEASHHRRCDYAYRLLCEVLKIEYRYHPSKAVRDINISAMRELHRSGVDTGAGG